MILAECSLGAVGSLALGVFLLSTSTAVAYLVLGVWLLGLGANYVPLTFHAITLSRIDTLERELAGVDLRIELRHYTRVQFLVMVPFLLVVLALAQGARRS